MSLFELIYKCVDLRKMSEESARRLLNHIISVIESEEDRKEIELRPSCLFRLRKQSRQLTEELDHVISKNMPVFYNGVYKLETTENGEQDLPAFLYEAIDKEKKMKSKLSKSLKYF